MATNSNNTILPNITATGVAPSNIAAANLAASLAASAQQQIFIMNTPTGGKLQVVPQPPLLSQNQHHVQNQARQ